jgi:hypothetical protein
VYLRRTSRTNRDGTVTSYLALAHNYRDPDTGVSKPKILHSFGREDQLDPQALERLMASIARHLDVAVPTGADEPAALELEPIDGRDLGGAWVLDQLWARLGIGREIRKLARKPAHTPGRKLDVALLERILFALVAGRALAPSSKLEATRWIREEVYIPGLAEVDHTACYRAMDWLLDHLPALQETVFFAVADLLNLDVDLIFFDTTSTYFETEFEDGELDGTGDGLRQRGHSKDSRPDLPQVVIGMAVTTGGLPVRLWVWPGDTGDTTVLAEVKTDLAGWRLNRTVWVVDAGFTSGDNRKVLTGAGSGFIIAEKLRGNEAATVAARSRQGRFRTVEEGLQVKDIRVGEGVGQQRFIMVRNLDAAARDACVDGWLRCSKTGSPVPTSLIGRSVRSYAGGSGRSPACGATYASPRPGCSGSTRPRSLPSSAWTARPCFAPPRWMSMPPRSPGATRPGPRSSGAGVTSSSSSCGRSITARTTASSPTCSSPGWRCC